MALPRNSYGSTDSSQPLAENYPEGIDAPSGAADLYLPVSGTTGVNNTADLLNPPGGAGPERSESPMTTLESTLVRRPSDAANATDVTYRVVTTTPESPITTLVPPGFTISMPPELVDHLVAAAQTASSPRVLPLNSYQRVGQLLLDVFLSVMAYRAFEMHMLPANAFDKNGITKRVGQGLRIFGPDVISRFYAASHFFFETDKPFDQVDPESIKKHFIATVKGLGYSAILSAVTEAICALTGSLLPDTYNKYFEAFLFGAQGVSISYATRRMLHPARAVSGELPDILITDLDVTGRSFLQRLGGYGVELFQTLTIATALPDSGFPGYPTVATSGIVVANKSLKYLTRTPQEEKSQLTVTSQVSSSEETTVATSETNSICTKATKFRIAATGALAAAEALTAIGVGKKTAQNSLSWMLSGAALIVSIGEINELIKYNFVTRYSPITRPSSMDQSQPQPPTYTLTSPSTAASINNVPSM